MNSNSEEEEDECVGEEGRVCDFVVGWWRRPILRWLLSKKKKKKEKIEDKLHDWIERRGTWWPVVLL